MTTRAWKSWAPSSIRYLVMMAAITLLACGRDTPSTAPPGAPVRLVISPAGLILDFGAQGLVRAHGIDANGRVTATVVEWSSDDPFIATVGRNDGVVIAVGAGRTTVTAIAGTLQATTTVVVRPPQRLRDLDLEARRDDLDECPPAVDLHVGQGRCEVDR